MDEGSPLLPKLGERLRWVQEWWNTKTSNWTPERKKMYISNRSAALFFLIGLPLTIAYIAKESLVAEGIIGTSLITWSICQRLSTLFLFTFLSNDPKVLDDQDDYVKKRHLPESHRKEEKEKGSELQEHPSHRSSRQKDSPVHSQNGYLDPEEFRKLVDDDGAGENGQHGNNHPIIKSPSQLS